MYENFSAPSTESLNSIFNRLQKIVSQLAILGEYISQEDSPASTASTQVSTANLSDATVYAFLASQPNISQLVHEDLKQIHEDDLEEMDLKWQLALLSMRTKRFFQKTGRKITINGSDTAGYDKSKVECFNCHKIGHFARECRGRKNQDSRNRNQDSSRRTKMWKKLLPKPWWLLMELVLTRAIWQMMKSLQTWLLWLFQTLSLSLKAMDLRLVRVLVKIFLMRLGNLMMSHWLRSWCQTDKLEKKTAFPTVAKIEFVKAKQQEKPVRKPVKYAEMYRSQTPREIKETRIIKSDCNYHQRERVVSGNNYTRVNYNYSAKKAHPSAHRNMVPRAVLMKTGLRSLNTARPVNTAHPKTTVYSARPMSHFSKLAQSTVNAIKASACWVWRPTKLNSASITLKRHNYVDARGISKSVMALAQAHDRGNIPILSDIKNLMEDMLPLGEEPKKGKLRKTFRVYNIRTRKVEENLHIRFLEDKPIVAGDGPRWLFDINVLTKSMNYEPVVACTNSNDFVGTKESIGAGYSSKEKGSSQDYILMPL
ncbi:ribonuclease H-like domain-containing protein [Tanacetum coccineum]